MSEHPTRYHVVTQLSEDTWVVRLARPTDEPNCDDLFLGASSLAPVAPDLARRSDLTIFAGFLTAQLPELHHVETNRMIDAVTAYLYPAARDRVAPPSRAQNDEKGYAPANDLPHQGGQDLRVNDTKGSEQ